MKTILIPVDFSATTENTIRFASAWAQRYNYKRIILLKTFYDTVFDNIVVSAEYAPVSQDYRQKERTECAEKMDTLAEQLTALVDPDVTVVTAFSETPLLRTIIETIRMEQPDLVLLGSDNYTESNDSFIAGNIISIARVSTVRVLIVPSDYTYQPVQNALVPCDYRVIHCLGKLNDPKDYLLAKDVRLFVLNVDPKEKYLQPDEQLKENENILHNYLQNYQHEIFYSNDKNVINGILQFSQQHDIQLLISLPGKHSFLYYWTRKSISEGIYRNAQVPVMILK